MASIIEALDGLASKGWYKEWQNPAWKQFVATGDERHLAHLPKFTGFTWLPPELLAALPLPDQLDDHGKRFLRACHAAGHPDALGSWIQKCATTGGEGAGSRPFDDACTLAIQLGYPKPIIAAQVTQHVRPICRPDGSPTPAGHYLLGLEDSAVENLALGLGRDPRHATVLAELFSVHAPERWRRLLETLNQSGAAKRLSPELWLPALKAAPALFLEPAARALELLEEWDASFELGRALYDRAPGRFVVAMDALTSAALRAVEPGADKHAPVSPVFAAAPQPPLTAGLPAALASLANVAQARPHRLRQAQQAAA